MLPAFPSRELTSSRPLLLSGGDSTFCAGAVTLAFWPLEAPCPSGDSLPQCCHPGLKPHCSHGKPRVPSSPLMVSAYPGAPDHSLQLPLSNAPHQLCLPAPTQMLPSNTCDVTLRNENKDKAQSSLSALCGHYGEGRIQPHTHTGAAT